MAAKKKSKKSKNRNQTKYVLLFEKAADAKDCAARLQELRNKGCRINIKYPCTPKDSDGIVNTFTAAVHTIGQNQRSQTIVFEDGSVVSKIKGPQRPLSLEVGRLLHFNEHAEKTFRTVILEPQNAVLAIEKSSKDIDAEAENLENLLEKGAVLRFFNTKFLPDQDYIDPPENSDNLTNLEKLQLEIQALYLRGHVETDERKRERENAITDAFVGIHEEFSKKAVKRLRTIATAIGNENYYSALKQVQCLDTECRPEKQPG